MMPLLDEDEEICTCTVFGEACAMPAAFYATAGCVHEHLGTRPLCDQHAEQVRHHDPRIKCGYCRRAGHECDLLVAEIKPITMGSS
jgi:hypothetical protein